MIVQSVQRWRDRRDSYRPLGEPIRTSDYDVVAERGIAEVKRWIGERIAAVEKGGA